MNQLSTAARVSESGGASQSVRARIWRELFPVFLRRSCLSDCCLKSAQQRLIENCPLPISMGPTKLSWGEFALTKRLLVPATGALYDDLQSDRRPEMAGCVSGFGDRRDRRLTATYFA